MKIVLASNNSGKLREIEHYLSAFPITLQSQSVFHTPPVEETASTFVENALIKARHAAQHCQLPALAEDSGLCVEALKGNPGVRSARFANDQATDEANRQKLLALMESFPPQQRDAYFFCTLVFLQHPLDPTPIICQAKWEGQICTAPRGKQGFGYDSLFFIPAMQCTAAELSLEQKNTLSHRAQSLAAFVKLVPKLGI